ncbi:MAG TPA: hypothetical protein VGH38_26660 [Bryobacteraceae bacterium]
MVRTQVQLSEDQLDALRKRSAETGESIAQLVRLGVELYLSSQFRPSRADQIARARGIGGKFRSGQKDVSARHDHYLAEAFLK